jgi:hypothetical protein
MWDFVMDKSGVEAGFLRKLSVSLANIHSIYFSTIIFTITRGWHNRPGVAAVPIVSQTKNNKRIIIIRWFIQFPTVFNFSSSKIFLYTWLHILVI